MGLRVTNKTENGLLCANSPDIPLFKLYFLIWLTAISHIRQSLHSLSSGSPGSYGAILSVPTEVFVSRGVYKYRSIFSYHVWAKRVWKYLGGQMHHYNIILTNCQLWFGKMNPFQFWEDSEKLLIVSNYFGAPEYLSSYAVLTCLSCLPVSAMCVLQLDS